MSTATEIREPALKKPAEVWVLRLAPAVIEAVKEWRYRPIPLHDEPVAAATTITVISGFPTAVSMTL